MSNRPQGIGKQVGNMAEQASRYQDDVEATKKNEHPGAYKIKTKMLGLMRDHNTWKLIEILDVRQAKLFNEVVDSDEEEGEDYTNLEKYDQLPVSQHPKQTTSEQNRETYYQKYIKQFKAEQKDKSVVDKSKDLNVNDKDTVMKNEDSKSAKAEQPKSMRYEYYIHYLGIDRRMDRWVTEHFLKLDPVEIAAQDSLIMKSEEEKKNKANMDREKQYLFNDENHGMSEKDVDQFINQTKFKTVESIQFGQNWLETWYFTALPKEYHTKCLYICDFCFFFCVHKKEFLRHSMKCDQRYPPGDEIYRGSDFAFFEIDGTTQRVYCENLSYVSRMFLDHKNIYNSIEAFLFYVLCEVKEDGFHFVGYFSKDKIRVANTNTNNLSCIMVMPFCQRSGYGKLLIEMSYALSIIEKKPGGPERPLSDLGHRTYVSFWTRRVVEVLFNLAESTQEVSINKIRDLTGMTETDIIYILNNQKILRNQTLCCDRAFLEKILSNSGRPGRKIPLEDIRWRPYRNLAEQKDDVLGINL